jgi:hypothetical protein
MQAETSYAVQLVLLMGCQQFCDRSFVPFGADNRRSVVATPRDAKSSRKVLPPSWLDFFQDS